MITVVVWIVSVNVKCLDVLGIELLYSSVRYR